MAVFRHWFPEWGNILLAFAPLLWLELLPRARARYQRRGEAIERDIEGLRVMYLIFVFAYAFLAPVVLVMHQLRWARETGPVGWVALVAAAAALVLAAPRARRNTRGFVDSLFAMVLVMPMNGAIRGAERDPVELGFLLALAGLFLVSGIYQHLAFGRLERRLAALKVPA